MTDKNTEHDLDSLYTQSYIDDLVEKSQAGIKAAKNAEELKEAKIEYTGEKSAISELNRGIGKLPAQQKAQAGKIVGMGRGKINKVFEQQKQKIDRQEQERILKEEAVDVTANSPTTQFGARHPLVLLQDKVADIFLSMGWSISSGPELEHEWINFDALNFPPDHPARAMQDTFFVDPTDAVQNQDNLLLRTHTSPVQIRSIIKQGVPLYVLSPGRVYRTDELDSTHTPVFNQIEGLAIDKNLSMADLKGTLEYFARQMFGPNAKIRLRPSYFPFTEPSAELDIWYTEAKGGPAWVEWGGCGMVNPRVLASAGIDSEEYSGFAFGMGVERTLMFRNFVSDMREMIEGDIRFSQQFGMEV